MPPEGEVDRGDALERVSLRPDWDATHYFGLLTEELPPDWRGPIFVGRDRLLREIIAATVVPEYGGAFLVSGHRGAGKTALVVEGALRSRSHLPDGTRLFPVHVGVTGLGVRRAQSAEESSHDDRLQVVPRALLVALVDGIASTASRLSNTQEPTAPDPPTDRIRSVQAWFDEVWNGLWRDPPAKRSTAPARPPRIDTASDVTPDDDPAGEVVPDDDPAGEVVPDDDPADEVVPDDELVPAATIAPPVDWRRLAQEANELLDKALASNFVEQDDSSSRTTASQTSSFRRVVSSRNLLNLLVALLTVATAAGLARQEWLVSVLAAVAASISLLIRSERSRLWANEEVASRRRQAQWENSLPVMERDVTSLLSRLTDQGARVIVVFDELDKLDDPGQLDRVMQYFKELFSQSRALFFFVTDKHYYDTTARRMQSARGALRYAMEHTFFAHRLFVPRDDAEQCYQYLAAIIADTEVATKTTLTKLADRDRERTRDPGSMTDWERFARYLLFLCENHLFDLKAVLRRYIVPSEENTKSVELAFDPLELRDTRSDEVAWQFLVEQKARSFAFPPGSEHATEVLRSCLYGLAKAFHQGVGGGPIPVGRLLPDRQMGLSASQIVQVESAVESLIMGLRDMEVITTDIDIDARSIRQANATAVERLSDRISHHRGIETYEEDYLSELSLLLVDLDRLGENGSLGKLCPDDVRRLAQQISEDCRSEQVALRGETIFTRAEIATKRTAAQLSVDRVYAELARAIVGRLQTDFSLAVTESSPAADGMLYELDTSSAEHPGRVFLAFSSQAENLARRNQRDGQMVAIVTVFLGRSARADRVSPAVPIERGPLRAETVTVTTTPTAQEWLTQLGDTIVLSGAWAWQVSPATPSGWTDNPVLVSGRLPKDPDPADSSDDPGGDAGPDLDDDTFGAALRRWFNDGYEDLVVIGIPPDALTEELATLGADRRWQRGTPIVVSDTASPWRARLGSMLTAGGSADWITLGGSEKIIGAGGDADPPSSQVGDVAYVRLHIERPPADRPFSLVIVGRDGAWSMAESLLTASRTVRPIDKRLSDRLRKRAVAKLVQEAETGDPPTADGLAVMGEMLTVGELIKLAKVMARRGQTGSGRTLLEAAAGRPSTQAKNLLATERFSGVADSRKPSS